MPSQRVQFAHPPTYRDSSRTKDARNVNGFFEKEYESKEMHYTKRAGLSTYSSMSAGTAQGLHSWLGNLYTIINGSVYKDGVLLGTVNSTGGRYYFVQNNAGTKLFFKNTTNAYYTDGVSITAISSVNYPATTVPGVAYLDGYFFVCTPSGLLYNSSIEDPTTWAATDYLYVQMEPNGSTFITKQLNYVCVLNPTSVQFFYDAANPSPGSPLSNVPNAYFRVGCASPYSVAQFENTVVWLSQSTQKGRSIYMMDGYSPQKISNAYIERVLNADTLSEVYATAYKIQGHNFYVLTLVNTNVSLVYDLSSGIWSEWTSFNGINETYFTSVYYANHNGTDVTQGLTNGKVYEISSSYYQDDGQPIYLRSRTDILDAGTNIRKFTSALDLIADKQSSTVQVRWTDDDYQTYNNYQTIDMSKERSCIVRLGYARRRAFEFLHTDNTPFRAEAFELKIESGMT